MRRFLLFSAILCSGLTVPTHAEVSLSNLFSDHMVLEREMPVPIWGKAAPAESVTVSFGGQTKTATADGSGAWRVVFDPMPASSESRDMRISGKNQITITDVVVGEVWLCSGQSNMQWSFDAQHGVDNNAQEIAAGNYPLIRHNNYPRGDGKWTVITPQTMPLMSAVPYFFSRALYQKLGVPIGILNRSNGGTSVEAWSSPTALSKTAWGRELLDFTKSDAMKAYVATNMELNKQFDAWRKNNSPPNAKPVLVVPPDVAYHGLRNLYNLPCGMYQQAIHPTAGYAMRGAVWYQGEENAVGNPTRVNSYAEMCSSMLEDWRAEWGQGDFPVICVQLPNTARSVATGYEPSSSWAAMREQITKIPGMTPKSSHLVTIDLAGNPAPIHYPHKVPVANRLALRVFQDVYGMKDAASYGPVYRSMEAKGSELEVQFDPGEGGLKLKGGTLGCFAVAGADKVFFPAHAEIDGNAVEVSSDQVKTPVAVRYAWANNPHVDLYNGADLPAGLFRTDTWEIPELGKNLPQLNAPPVASSVTK